MALKHIISGSSLVKLLTTILQDICDSDSDEMIRFTEELLDVKSVDYDVENDSITLEFEEDAIPSNIPTRMRSLFCVLED